MALPRVKLLLLVLLAGWGGAAGAQLPSTTTTTTTTTTGQHSRALPPVRLFITVLTSPSRGALRDAARATWLAPELLQPLNVSYRFFTQPAPLGSDDAVRLADEAARFGDIVVDPGGAVGYKSFAARTLFQLGWAKRHVGAYDFVARVDDDAYMCVRRVAQDLAYLPTRRFFWAKYHCREGKVVPDENFMVFSRDLASFVVRSGPLLRRPGTRVSLAPLMSGLFHWLDLYIFDDRDRIDAQQAYTTEAMHVLTLPSLVPAHFAAEYRGFCDRHVFAHHVRLPDVMYAVHAALDPTAVYPPPPFDPAVGNHICFGKDYSLLLNASDTSATGQPYPNILATSTYSFTHDARLERRLYGAPPPAARN